MLAGNTNEKIENVSLVSRRGNRKRRI